MLWKQVATFILKKRWYFVALILLFTGVMGYFATKVELEYSMRKLVPDSDPDMLAYQKFKKKFGDDGNKLVCAFDAKDLFQISNFT